MILREAVNSITLGGKLSPFFESTDTYNKINDSIRPENRFHPNSDFVGLFVGLAFIALI